ncbi:hypothetical protein [Caldimonas tepidiphila]|uniref:hypothetical protein n=1 Tax=Caldimonas tepidiphila TaxID=2315841 RepID=UPI001300451C|nr:hypothetical protein [Caldimonas tepidiphila]
MSGWIDAGVDSDRLVQGMLEHEVLLAPGLLFRAQRPPISLMRINQVGTQDVAFWTLFNRCRCALQEGSDRD